MIDRVQDKLESASSRAEYGVEAEGAGGEGGPALVGQDEDRHE